MRSFLLLAASSIFILFSVLNPACAQSVRVFEWHRGQSTIGVLFIHGIGGCAVPNDDTAAHYCAGGTDDDTFRNAVSGKTWPQIIAADNYTIARSALRAALQVPLRMSDLGLWGVDYSKLTTSSCPSFSIPEVAREVRVQVEASGLFQKYEQVIIVTHSMGGLIAKEMLLQWQTAGDPDGMAARTIGLFLLGVPSQGSPIAPEPGVQQYLAQALHLDKLLNLCGRQVKDIFAGDANTYLFDLERRWESFLGARRAVSQSTAPLVYCAYETVPEPAGHGIFNIMIVKHLYTETQCSQSAFPIGVSHTNLPKPQGPLDDVNVWLSRSLDDLFKQWAAWPFARFEFANGESFDALADRVESSQNAFRLEVNTVRQVAPPSGRFSAPNDFALVSKIGSAAHVCLETQWREEEGLIILKAGSHCSP